MKVWVIILAGGQGHRFRSATLKQFTNLCGQPVVAYSARVLSQISNIGGVVFVLPKGHIWGDYVQLPSTFSVHQAQAGQSRGHSLFNGFGVLKQHFEAGKNDWVLIHDAARPNISLQIVQKLLNAVEHEPYGGILGLPIVETIKRINQAGRVIDTVDRAALYVSQTPQMYRLGVLNQLLEKYYDQLSSITDESMLFERAKYPIALVEGDKNNIKITTKADLKWLKHQIKQPIA